MDRPIAHPLAQGSNSSLADVCPVIIDNPDELPGWMGAVIPDRQW